MSTPHPSPETLLVTVSPLSRYIQRLLESEPEQRDRLLAEMQRPFLREEMQAYLDTRPENKQHEALLHRDLRNLRKQVMLRIATRDLGGLADLSEIMASMTDLAEVTINAALKQHHIWLMDRFGAPIGEKSRTAQQMLVVAMGKLGGRELNVSSDVDLIFIYPEDGETDGTKSIANHDFFARLGRKLIASLNDYTVDSYVFRVDMRLRPYGEDSPLAMSFAMLQEYFVTQGREWERYAWIKGRVIAGPPEAATTLMEQIARPFVFRKYLDLALMNPCAACTSRFAKRLIAAKCTTTSNWVLAGFVKLNLLRRCFS